MRNLILSRLNACRLWSIGLIVLVLAGLVFVPGAVAQEAEGPLLTVVAPAINLRSGPSGVYPPYGFLLQGQQVTVIGYDAANWWHIQRLDGTTGWVNGSPAYVSINAQAAVFKTAAPEQSPPPAAPAAPAPATSTLVFQTASGGPIYAIRPDGTNLRYLTTGLDPILSPDGQQVTFARWETSQDGALGNLWLINVDGAGERVLMDNVHNPRTPVWSPDGSQIVISMQLGGRTGYVHTCTGSRPPRDARDIQVFLRGPGDIEFCYTLLPDPHWTLRRVAVATGAYENLPGDTYTFSPAWSPGEKGRLVYNGDAGLMNLNLADQTRWPLTDDVNDHSPVFSPDGSKIALTYRQDDHWEVHVMNADGSGRVRLTQTSYLTLAQQQLNGELPHSFNNAAPTWSPDGSQIAFLTDRAGRWEIWLMNADGSSQRPMFPAGTLANIPLQYNGVDEQALSWR
jgi:dipeptidyl aminopeptidase/acylaminoacyl peptidase